MNAPAEKSNFPFVVLAAGALCVLLAMGIRSSFGLFQAPMLTDLKWKSEVFALAMAIQNLMWGAFQPIAAAMAERWGTGRTIAGGGILYAVGLYIMSVTTDPMEFHFSAGLLIGMAQAGCALAVVLSAVGRVIPPERRTLAFGIVTGAGAAGQFTIVPLDFAFIANFGWPQAYFLTAILALLILACAVFLRSPAKAPAHEPAPTETVGVNLREMLQLATRHRGFWLLTAGFFVCGFHVAFITVHMPKFLTDQGMSPEFGAYALMLIGGFNVIGSIVAGYLGDRWSKKYLLSALYTLRSLTILAFISLPISVPSVLIFCSAMGILWLSTVPLTSGLVAQMFGTKYMGTLFGIVFFSHQVGSFLGVWLGGYFYDVYGSYDPIWWAGIVIGLLSALLHWPINDRTVPQAVNA